MRPKTTCGSCRLPSRKLARRASAARFPSAPWSPGMALWWDAPGTARSPIAIRPRTLKSSPCAMCAGALIQARIARLVYGADDPKGGAVRSCFSVLAHPRLNHQVEVVPGLLAEQSAALLQEFFAARR